MKKIFTLILFLSSQVSFAQMNLVPNPSFEDTVQCPDAYNQIDRCFSWFNFGNTPDYFNACANPGGVNVPNTSLGYSTAHSGNAFAGIIFIQYATPSNWYEYIGTQLLQNLIACQKYFISFFIKKTNIGSFSLACNKIGIKFSNVLYSEFNPPSLIDTADFYTDSIIVDTLNWIQIKGSFIADSTYQYLIIGNFFNHNLIDTLHFNVVSSIAYYFLDNVCISTDSLLCSSWTGIQELDLNPISIFPNPANDFLTINFLTSENKSLIIYDDIGRLVLTKNNLNKKECIHIKDWKEGIYFMQLKGKTKFYTNKFIIIH